MRALVTWCFHTNGSKRLCQTFYENTTIPSQVESSSNCNRLGVFFNKNLYLIMISKIRVGVMNTYPSSMIPWCFHMNNSKQIKQAIHKKTTTLSHVE